MRSQPNGRKLGQWTQAGLLPRPHFIAEWDSFAQDPAYERRRTVADDTRRPTRWSEAASR